MFDKLMDSDNGLVITMNWITDCLFLSMLWLVLSVFVIPFGPATAALYDTAVHTFRGGEKLVYRRFFMSLKRNMKTGIPAGLIALLIALGGFKVWNLLGAAAVDSNTGYVFLWGFFVLFLLMLGMLSFLFPLLSRFETDLARLFGNCFLLCMANLPRTVALSLLFAVAAWICTWLWWPVVFVPCLWAVCASFFAEPIFAPFLSVAEADGTEAADSKNARVEADGTEVAGNKTARAQAAGAEAADSKNARAEADGTEAADSKNARAESDGKDE